jgi:predicted signal transduction protein with EAL and GGDEF domain
MPVLLEGKEFTPSASIGISVYPDDGKSVEALLKSADIAMYRAKAQGGNNHQFYSAQSNQPASERLAIEADLRRARQRLEKTA